MENLVRQAKLNSCVIKIDAIAHECKIKGKLTYVLMRVCIYNVLKILTLCLLAIYSFVETFTKISCCVVHEVDLSNGDLSKNWSSMFCVYDQHFYHMFLFFDFFSSFISSRYHFHHRTTFFLTTTFFKDNFFQANFWISCSLTPKRKPVILVLCGGNYAKWVVWCRT